MSSKRHLSHHKDAEEGILVIGVKKPDIPLNPSWDNNTIIADAQRASRKDMRKEVSEPSGFRLNHRLTRFKIIARDVYRCCVTGRLDVDVADLEPVEKATVLSEGPYVPGNLDTLQVAHVFPYSINKFDASNNVHSQRVIKNSSNQTMFITNMDPSGQNHLDRIQKFLWIRPERSPRGRNKRGRKPLHALPGRS